MIGHKYVRFVKKKKKKGENSSLDDYSIPALCRGVMGRDRAENMNIKNKWVRNTLLFQFKAKCFNKSLQISMTCKV